MPDDNPNLDLPQPEARQPEPDQPRPQTTPPGQQASLPPQTPEPNANDPSDPLFSPAFPPGKTEEKEEIPPFRVEPSDFPGFSLPGQKQVLEKPPGKQFALGRKMIFLILAGVAVIVLSFFVLNLLRKNKQPETEAALNYWGLWEPEPVIQGIIAQFEEEHPGIKINYSQQDKDDYRARMQAAFSRGEGPDIFRFHNTWTPMLKNELAPVPESLAGSLALETDYFPVISESIKQGGLYYGVPLMIDTLALYYNKDILSRANKSPPRTWWGLENLAKELTVRPDQKIAVAGAALGAISNVDHWSDIIGLMIYQNGGDPASPDGLTEDAIKYYLRFKNADRVWDESLPRSTAAFAAGKLAFYFGPSWRVFNILEANPDLNFGITTVPQLPKLRDTDWEAAERGEAELTDINWATFWVEGVSVKSRYQKEAWQFLQFLATEEIMQRLYTTQSQIRPFGELYPRIDLAEDLKGDSLIRPFIDQAPTAKSWYLCSFTRDAGINDRIISYYETAINTFEEPAGETKAMEPLTNGIKQVLNQYGVN
ncbi:extracellular solute-binding protein [Patescibacteria group bacterium]|nr:extracellular solute-binding protein [Patescibacteria group bacterium]